MTSPDVRASDADRERVAVELRGHMADGRLTLDELSDRLDAAYGARTVGELEALTRDLPTGAAAPPPSSRTPTRWSVAVMGSVDRKRRWRIAERSNAVAVMGGVHLDLRQSEITSPEVEITAVAVMGGIEIVVPEGVEVEVTGFAFMGARQEHIAETRVLPGAPRIHVRAYAFMGGVDIRSRPSGRPPQATLRPPPLPPPPP
jgi:uncharacterized protein DUF1707/cell wall-active antibiotic response 4TMS protein YvqF